MINQPGRIKILLEKAEWTAEEEQWLLNYLENSDASELKELMQKLFSDDLENTKKIAPSISERLLIGIHQRTGISQKNEKAKQVRLWTWRMAAACVVGFLAFSTYLLLRNNSNHQTAQTQADNKVANKDVKPGSDKAVLTLADGSTIMLEDTQNGAVAKQGNTNVVKLNGKLDYNASGSQTPEILYNTIATPRGGQYEVQLPDGTHVWLNAASSLRFPTAFTGINREVELTGEAFFEVAKNKSIPFVVNVQHNKVTVLGTHFNINAYSDEKSINTTLLEGSVKFNAGLQEKLLKPGQQSVFTPATAALTVKPVDINQVIAWKNGFFEFDNTDLATIMRQISRWYDVDISYQTRDSKSLFGGGISRKLNLSEVLHLLETNGVHFKIENKKVIVL